MDRPMTDPYKCTTLAQLADLVGKYPPATLRYARFELSCGIYADLENVHLLREGRISIPPADDPDPRQLARREYLTNITILESDAIASGARLLVRAGRPTGNRRFGPQVYLTSLLGHPAIEVAFLADPKTWERAEQVLANRLNAIVPAAWSDPHWDPETGNPRIYRSIWPWSPDKVWPFDENLGPSPSEISFFLSSGFLAPEGATLAEIIADLVVRNERESRRHHWSNSRLTGEDITYAALLGLVQLLRKKDTEKFGTSISGYLQWVSDSIISHALESPSNTEISLASLHPVDDGGNVIDDNDVPSPSRRSALRTPPPAEAPAEESNRRRRKKREAREAKIAALAAPPPIQDFKRTFEHRIARMTMTQAMRKRFDRNNPKHRVLLRTASVALRVFADGGRKTDIARELKIGRSTLYAHFKALQEFLPMRDGRDKDP